MSNARIRLLLVLLTLTMSACGQAETSPPVEPTEPVQTAPPVASPEPDLAANQIKVEGRGVAPNDDGKIVVSYVSAAEPGWLVVHADADGAYGPVMGYTQVATGDNHEVAVEVAPSELAWRVHLVLYVDKGTVGEFEVPGTDTPALNASGRAVSLPYTLSGHLTWVQVEDQQLGDDSTVEIARAFSPGLGILVIHASDRPSRPGIAWAPLQSGENVDVVVQVELEAESETLEAMLHSDFGTIGEYEGFGVDPAATTLDGDVVVVPFIASSK